MFYIQKQTETPANFATAVAGLSKYDDLKDENRTTVSRFLQKEQGGLCPICERDFKTTVATIEHFLPKSIFPHLQLDYYNLYACCSKCNEPKAEHLIPSYIFDPRFSPFLESGKTKAIKPIYSYNPDTQTCRVLVPEALHTTTKDASILHSAYIMQATLDLLQQNRNETPTTDKEEAVSLLHLRGVIWKTLMNQPDDPKKWQAKYDALRERYENQTDYLPFISLYAYWLQKKLKTQP